MRSARSPTSRHGALLLAIAAVMAPLARGSVDPWVEAAVVALGLASFLLAALERPAIPRASLGLLAVLGMAAFLLVPLPPALHALSPGAVRIFEVSLAPLGLYPAARPLSLDPAATARELAKAIGCTAAFVAAWSYSDTRRRKQRILTGLALSSAAVAAVVLGAALVGAGDLLAPRFPFVNPNHLAGFLGATAFVALGLAFREHGQARALWALAFIAGGAVVFLSLSRGGIGAFFVGATVFVALHVRSRRERDQATHPGRHVVLAGVLATAVGAAAFLALDPVVGELRSLRGGTDVLKLRLLAPAIQVIREFLVFGVGPGAFPSVFAGYEAESSAVTFTHLENEWLQPIVDLGIPAGLLLVGTFAWVWVSAARRRELGHAEIGLLAGTAAVAAHNAFDFSLGILGVALPFAVEMGLLARTERAVSLSRRTAFGALAAGVLVSSAGIATAARHELDADRDRVEQARGAAATAQAARSALGWHPADWVPHALAGTRAASETGCGGAMPWLQRAMLLDPGAPAPHLATARCLVGRNDAAAKREYRLAIMFGQRALEEAASVYPELDDLLQVAPGTPDGLLALGAVLASAKRQADAAAVFTRVIDEFADERGVLPLAYARAALQDDEAAIALARRHAAVRPSDPGGWVLAAEALVRLGREDDARVEVERGLAAAPGSPRLLGFLAGRAMAARRWSEAKRLAEEIAPRTPAEIAAKHLLVARTLAGQGRNSEALDRARSAAGVLPEDIGPSLAVADYAARTGQYEEAVAALRHAANLRGAPPHRFAAQIAELEAAQEAQRQRILMREAVR